MFNSIDFEAQLTDLLAHSGWALCYLSHGQDYSAPGPSRGIPDVVLITRRLSKQVEAIAASSYTGRKSDFLPFFISSTTS